MTGKILTGSLLSLTLLACAAFGCQGACGSLEQEAAGQVETQENEMDWRASGQTPGVKRVMRVTAGIRRR